MQGLRKAAILVAAMDRATADSLLEAMSSDQAAMVRHAVLTMDPVDPAEQRRVIDEFLRQGHGRVTPRVEPSGIELDGPLGRRLAERNASPAHLPLTGARPGGTPFRFLQAAEGEDLGRILATERPQTIALVLSHLPPERAGAVLVQLAPATQVEVVRRLVDLEETDPEILREVENALETRLSQQVPLRRRRVAGLNAVGGILKASGAGVGRQILDNLSSFDPNLADQLTPSSNTAARAGANRPTIRLTFDDFAELSGEALAEIAQSAGPELLSVAMVGAPAALIGRLTRHLPRHEAKALRAQWERPVPTRLSDVDQARQCLIELAQTLAASGRINLSAARPGTLRMTA